MNRQRHLVLTIVVPVYNRPRELAELLDSLTRQSYSGVEVIVIDDGSSPPCKPLLDSYFDQLNLRYFFVERGGAGAARNYGCMQALGNYFVILDSDCVLPSTYVEAVHKALCSGYADAFGGAERQADDFSPLQKAIGYAMTSVWTTGGLRGNTETYSRFYPRSFNMGYSKEVFEATGGFSNLPVGEDIDLSMRIERAGFSIRLIPDAFVFHKRGIGLFQFIRRVYSFGVARVQLTHLHVGSFRWIYALPSMFTFLGAVLLVMAVGFRTPYFLLPVACYAMILLLGAFWRYRSLPVAGLAMVLGCAQVMGYGLGFAVALVANSRLGAYVRAALCKLKSQREG